MKRKLESAMIFLALQIIFLAIGIANFFSGSNDKTEGGGEAKEVIIFLIGFQLMIAISLLVRFVFDVTNTYWLLSLDVLLAIALALLAFKTIMAVRKPKRTNNRSA